MPSEWAKALRPCVVFRKITNGYLMISWCLALANRAITAATCLVAQVQRGALLAKFLERPLCYQTVTKTSPLRPSSAIATAIFFL
jgi:hypothetical protein